MAALGTAGLVGLLSGGVRAIGDGVSSFFGFKIQQTITDAVIATEAAKVDVALAQASVQALQNIYVSGPPIERLWRPVSMWIFLTLIVLQWCGVVPPHMALEEIHYIYTFFYVGLIGYMPCRSFDKWARLKYGPDTPASIQSPSADENE